MTMKIVFAYPAYWPYVRRGAERCIHDLSTYLARRGHQVDIITTKPGRPRITHEEGVRIIYLRQLSHPLMFYYCPMLRLYTFGLEATSYILRNHYDVAHLMSYSEIFSAPLLQRWQNLPYLFHLIMREHWWPSRFDEWIFRKLIRRANQVAALTPKWAEHASTQYRRPVSVLPPPVDMEVFQTNGAKDLRRPQILFTGDLGDPRKGSTLLFRAWEEIHRRCPEAVLVVGGQLGMAGFESDEGIRAMRQLSPAARAAVEIRGPGTVGQLPQWYAEAAVTVLPSFDEAFGMVVTESLASGTPVVCSSDGGPGEIITQPDIGATIPVYGYDDLFSQKRAQELTEAVLYAVDLARQPNTTQRCRSWAEQWSLERVGRRAEEMYEEMVDCRLRAPHFRSARAGQQHA